MFNTLQPHGQQHTRVPCPSLLLGVCSNSCPLSQRCCPTILSSFVPFFTWFHLFQHQGLFQWVISSHQVAKVLELQLQLQNWFSLGLTYGEGNGTPLQYSCLENPMDGGAWLAAVDGVTEGRTWLSGFTFTFHFHALEKEMATHSSILAWGTPGTGEPGGLPPMGLHRVGHDWSDLVVGLT